LTELDSEPLRTTYSWLHTRYGTSVEGSNVGSNTINILVYLTNLTGLYPTITPISEGWVQTTEPFYEDVWRPDHTLIEVGEPNIDPIRELYCMGLGLFAKSHKKLNGRSPEQTTVHHSFPRGPIFCGPR